MIELDVKPEWVGKTLMELHLRKKYSINVVAIIKDNNTVSINFNPEEPISKEMRLIVIANKNKLSKLK